MPFLQHAAHGPDGSAPERPRLPRPPVRQWVLSAAKRLCYFMQRDRVTLNMVLRTNFFCGSLHQAWELAATVQRARTRQPCVLARSPFFCRFGSSLNEHVHFHVCAIDGVLGEVAGEGDADADDQARAHAHLPGAIFHLSIGVAADAATQVQTALRRRILRAIVVRRLFEGF